MCKRLAGIIAIFALLAAITGGLNVASAQSRVISHGQATHVVTIKKFAFHPKVITIKKGQTVTWVNDSSTQHTATSNSLAFDTGTINPHHKAHHTFKKTGTFKYHCSFHSFMNGTVIVKK